MESKTVRRPICKEDICILDLLLIVYVLVFVLALEFHMLMLVSAPVSFLFFLCISICVVFFCSGDQL